MPTKKKASKGDRRPRKTTASKGEAKEAPVEASRASAQESTRATQASEQENATSASKIARSTSSEQPRAKRSAPAKAAKGSPRRGADPVSAALADAPPTSEQIAVRAYELFARSGYQHGHADEHWLQAERELRREFAAKKRAADKPRPTFSSF